KIFKYLGAFLSVNLERIFFVEESKIEQRLDNALVRSIRKDSLSKGLQCFIEEVREAFQTTVAQVRILKEDRLVLLAGDGGYYDAVKKYRPKIDSNGESPTAVAFQRDYPMVTNDTQHSVPFAFLYNQHQNDADLIRELDEVRSFANIPFHRSNPDYADGE